MPRMPQVTARELIRFLESQGFVEDRQAGSHTTLWHATDQIAITIHFSHDQPLRPGAVLDVLCERAPA